MLVLLSDIEGNLITSTPVGGLPETAREQLERFMVGQAISLLCCGKTTLYFTDTRPDELFPLTKIRFFLEKMHLLPFVFVKRLQIELELYMIWR